MHRFRMGPYMGAIALMAVLGLGSGCAADTAPEDAERDIIEEHDGLSCEVSACDEVPKPSCEGDQLLTFYAACEDGQCVYPIAATLACHLGCEAGACRPD